MNEPTLPKEVEAALSWLMQATAEDERIADAEEAVRRTTAKAIQEAYERGKRDGAHNPSLDWALNSGDGVYRP